MHGLLLVLFLGVGSLLPVPAQAGPLIASALSGDAQGTGAGATWTVGAGAVPTGTATIITDLVTPITQFQILIQGNPGPGTFAAGAPGEMRVNGVVNAKTAAGLVLLGVPIRFGEPGTFQHFQTGIGVTGFANAWTTATTAIALTTPSETWTAMGSNGLVDGEGTVVLVTALNAITSASIQLPSFAILTLTYAPEPATALLLGAAVTALVAIGRRRG